VSAAGGEEVVEIDVATDTILKTFSADSTDGVAANPTNSQVFIAETGQYQVIAANPATGAETPIYVGRTRRTWPSVPMAARSTRR
jgi:hypothetical protein